MFAASLLLFSLIIRPMHFTTPAVHAKPHHAVTARQFASREVSRSWPKSRVTQERCIVKLWTMESHWNPRAANSSGAYGIPQALPGRKMSTAGKDWKTNPITQVRWGLSYVVARYGTPCNALQHEENFGWY